MAIIDLSNDTLCKRKDRDEFFGDDETRLPLLMSGFSVFGTMVSAVFIQFASYRWIFFFTTIVGVPAALLCIILIPAQEQKPTVGTTMIQSQFERIKRLDLIGVSILTGMPLQSSHLWPTH